MLCTFQRKDSDETTDVSRLIGVFFSHISGYLTDTPADTLEAMRVYQRNCHYDTMQIVGGRSPVFAKTDINATDTIW